MSYKPAENTLQILAIIFLLTYLFIALQYPANEFSRPYLFCLYIIAGTTLLAFFCRLVVATPMKEIARLGSILGVVISLIFLASNYIFNTEVSLKYEVLSVSQGKGNSVNWKVKTNQGESFSLNVRDKYSSAYHDLTFYRGMWGYYFGKSNKIIFEKR